MSVHITSKPVDAEAVLFDGTNADEILKFAGEAVTLLNVGMNDVTVRVHTNNGPVDLLRGHWLIRGASDYYPCDPQTFDHRWTITPRPDAVL